VVDFINEVEEELRKDEYNRLLKKFGPLIVAVIVAIVGGTGFLEYRKYTQDKAARATSASYVAASDQANEGQQDAALKGFLDIADKAPAGYAGLSLVRAATLKLEAGERAEAVSLLDQAATRFETPRHIQLAKIKAAYILAGEGAYNDVLSRSGPLSTKDAPYEFLARELMGFAALHSGDESKAREQYGYLASIPGVPATIKARAKQALSLMSTQSALEASKDAPQESSLPVSMPASDVMPENKTTPALETTETDNDE